MGGGGIDDARLRSGVDQRHGCQRGVVGQAQHGKVRRVKGVAAGRGALALLVVEHDQLELAARRKPLDDFKAGGSGGAIDKYGVGHNDQVRSS